MEPGSPEGQVVEEQGPLPKETQKALDFVNDIEMSLTTPKEKEEFFRDLQSQLFSFMLNIRPSVLAIGFKDPDAIQKLVDQYKKNAFVYNGKMIVDRDLVQQRISEETDFAKALGWKDGMSIDAWLKQGSPKKMGRQSGIIGFFLGYPKSAVIAYSFRRIKKSVTVNIEGPYESDALIFATDKSLVDSEDVKALKEKYKTAFEKAGLGRDLK
ncbi:MAG: hypothetical protein WC663_00900 [Patescibacteria group bacterium]|jgi:hypothetical protein